MNGASEENFASNFSIALPYLALLPLLHLAASALYLCGFALGFGVNIATLFTLSDLVNLGAGWLPLLYSTATALLFLQFSVYHVSVKSGLRFQPQRPITRYPILFLFIAMLISSPVLAIWEIWTAIYYPRAASLIFILQFPYTLVLLSLTLYQLRYRMARRRYILVSCSVAGPMAIMMAALDDGHRARYLEYQFASEKFVSCKGRPVIKSFAVGKLAVNPNGTKAFLNDDCEPALTVPEPRWLALVKETPVSRAPSVPASP